MDKAKRSQILKLFLISALLFITPLLSSSLRTKYLYFIIINLLIIALGAEAGLLSSFSRPPQDKKLAVPPPVVPKPVTASEASPDKEASTNSTHGILLTTPLKKPEVVEKSASEKIVGAVKISKVTKCPSTPSLFFIGGGEAEAEEVAMRNEEEEEEIGGITRQELFTKAEAFIGNFYKQLKMQREESWKRLHEFYQKAF